MGVYAEGMSDLQKELADMQKWDMKSFAISDYKVTSASPDTCVTTYKVKLKARYDGKDKTGTYNAGSVWKKQNGQWHGDLSHERETGASRRIDSIVSGLNSRLSRLDVAHHVLR